MNARKTAPLIGIVSLAALLSGVTGAQALPEQVVVDSSPTAAEAQGARLSEYAAAYAAATKDVTFERTETIRSVKQAEAGAATKDFSFDRAETIRSVKEAEAAAATRLSPAEAQGVRLEKYAEAQAEATDSAGSDTVDDDLSPMRSGR